MAEPTDSNETKPSFVIQRIYTKDLSFESPQSPDVFRREWKPKIELALKTNAQPMADDTHEVVLHVTVTAKLDEDVVFLVEVQQAGLFALKNFEDDRLKYMLGSYCPNLLFPYAREVVSDVVVRGNFPPFVLVPVDFDTLYAQHLQRQQTAEAGAAATTEQEAE